MPVYSNEFTAPKYIQETIRDASTGETIGTIRIKPSSVLWKPKGQYEYYSVTLDAFAGWITSLGTGTRRIGG
jgi:hypothetical protein